ncbi:MAG: ATP12 family protein [Alphaproteobacteria bacterium]
MKDRALRRFYKMADAAAAGGGFEIRLDGRPIRTPAKAALVVPAEALAAAIAAEWAAQGDPIDPASMPLTQLANAAIDRVMPDRDAVIAATGGYAEADLLCHRAERPAALAERQRTVWQPLLDWAAATYNAPLTVTIGVLPVAQPADGVAALHAAVAAHDDMALAALAHVTGLLGSVVLGLALSAGRIAVAEAFDAAHIDDVHQAERWGEDAEAAARLRLIRAEIDAAARFLDLLRR